MCALNKYLLSMYYVPDTILGTGAEPDMIPFVKEKCESVSHSVVSSSLWSHGLLPTRLLYSWDFPGKNIRVASSSSSRESFWPRDQTHVSSLAGRFFTTDPPGKPRIITYLFKTIDMYNTRSEPQYKLRTLNNDAMSTLTNVLLWWGSGVMLITEEAVRVWKHETSVPSAQFCCEPKTSVKNKKRSASKQVIKRLL